MMRSAAQPRQALPALTGARFVAAIVVVLFHTVLPRLGEDGLLVRLLGGGYLGVSFFFVLSGFILAYTYLHDTSALRASRRAFWRARFARVYPVYVLALVVAAPLFLKQWILDVWQTERLSGGLLAAALSPLLLQAWWPTAGALAGRPPTGPGHGARRRAVAGVARVAHRVSGASTGRRG
jgi:peptidoglycan/LPS O-acetylase OafA/YrhL